MRKIDIYLLLFAMMFSMVTPLPVSAQEASDSPPTQLALEPEADTFVHESNPNTDFAMDEKLLVGNGRESYLRFDLGQLNTGSTIVKASLRLYKLDSNTNTLSVTKVVYDDWDETITFNTKPVPDGGELAQFTASGKNTYVEVDLTDAVRAEVAGDQKLSIHLKKIGGSNYANEFVSSRGADPAQHPVLMVDVMTDEQIVAADKESLRSIDGGVLR